ncbi:hypothetical protein (mitochondrion) [Phanerochaete sordida]|uniref:Small ribosomal subunit protein uS3m n=1 Tax=Phanerochaete sordida TaxID=48140 RepID=A0A9N7KZ78_9APHY|nr:hypothetical protein [Phanerochaete sordida]
MEQLQILKIKGQNLKYNTNNKLEPFYSRILHNKVDLNEYKTKVDLELKSILGKVKKEKSLKLRVLDITKFTNKIKKLSSNKILNNGQIIKAVKLQTPIKSKVVVNAVNTDKVVQQSQVSAVSAKSNTTNPILKIILSTLKAQHSNHSVQPKKSNLAVAALAKWRELESVSGNASSKIKGIKKLSYSLQKFQKSLTGKYIRAITKIEPEISQFQNIVYNFNNNKKKFKINSILENSFFSLKSLIGTPVLEITPNNITINLFYYLKKLTRRRHYMIQRSLLRGKKSLAKSMLLRRRIKLLNFNYLKSLIFFLSKKFNKPITLDLTRLFHPSLDSKISANALGLLANKLLMRYLKLSNFFLNSAKVVKPTKIKKLLSDKFSKTNKLGVLTGINLKKGGRLLTQPIIPRLTTKIMQKGSIKRGNTDIVTTSRFTGKNKRGAFSITVTMGYKFF